MVTELIVVGISILIFCALVILGCIKVSGKCSDQEREEEWKKNN